MRRSLRNIPLKYRIGGGIVLLLIILLGWHFAHPAATTAATPPTVAHVTLASVSSLSNQAGPLQVTGTVTSLSQATVLAQSSGEIVSLSHALGDHVGVGAVIASFDTSSQQAAVLQAQGAYEAAQAALASASGNTAQNSNVTSSQASQNAQNTGTAALATLESTYTTLDDAVHTKADTLFSNPRSANPTLNGLTIPNSQLIVTLQNERLAIESTLNDAKSIAANDSIADIDANIAAMSSDVQTVQTFLNNMVMMINQAVPNQVVSASAIAGYQTMISTARSEVVSSMSSLAAAKSSYDSSLAGAATAANSATGGTSNSIAAAQANVKSALGALDAAQANLEKAIVRSPISGTIVSLSVTQGDYVSNFAPVAVISNPGALEVDTYVTSDDAKTLAIGGKATIDGTTNGTIVFIAPALDPTTGKIEVKIGITGSQSSLTDGSTVTVAITRSTTSGSAVAKAGVPAAITIPIASAKITPTGPVVFTVSSSTLVANPVVFGAINGSQVVIVSGITPETDIVTDARGLSDGETVIVDPGT
jgi:RND family efflux transporter MFP subunit